ncbi:MAG: hypothetical protein ISS72_02985 [Candidatus Brocadiae bacterium]|nr:hypothetical protein [Candidatus Brocadiia bacterium]
MQYEIGQLVRHPKFGLGKVLSVKAGMMEVFFKDEARKPTRGISTDFPLVIPDEQSDPWLDNLDVGDPRPDKRRKYLTHEQAVQAFFAHFPRGFYDPEYAKCERDYKWAAHELWIETLSAAEFEGLLSAGEWSEVAHRALRVESRTNLLFSFEKIGLRDALKAPEAARSFAHGLHDLIYGTGAYRDRFEAFTKVLDNLPQPQSRVVKWPVQTIFPFLALPEKHLFLKPSVTQQAAARRRFHLNYKSRPNWLTYSCLLKFGEILMEDLADLKPRDMIDIQSFIWVTGEGSYR